MSSWLSLCLLTGLDVNIKKNTLLVFNPVVPSPDMRSSHSLGSRIKVPGSRLQLPGSTLQSRLLLMEMLK